MVFHRWLKKVTRNTWRICWPSWINSRVIKRFNLSKFLVVVAALFASMVFFQFFGNYILDSIGEFRCPNMTIHNNHADLEISRKRACRPHTTPIEECRYTARQFGGIPSIEVCKDQLEPPYQLCSVSEQMVNTSYSSLSVKCNFSVCNSSREMSIEELNQNSGDLRKYVLTMQANHGDIERTVREKAFQARERGFTFLFLNCVGWNENAISQFISFLPPQKIFAKQKNEKVEKKVNVNIILLDSISRAHFYRSLPKTIEFLRMKENHTQSTGRVFEFELFQAVHGHTHENEHALFSGELYPSHFSEDQIDSAPTNVEVLFGIFKNAGYQTLYLDDLCWRTMYGLMDSVKAGGWWGNFRRKVKEANIDCTGITEASCKILERYGRSPFADEGQHQLCFNGKRTHQYFLEYIANYIHAVRQRSGSKPLFSFTALNVAHDNVGVRVQTLDGDLKSAIENLLREQDTLTIIYADHGNTYTRYQSRLEGRREMYHPMFLLILPEKLEEKFGKDIVSNLRTNQYRLLNLFDIRAGLVELARYSGRSPVKPKGIFGYISENRTCDDLQLTKASICLCEDWYQDVGNSSSQLTVAEFAIGQLNNRIQGLRLESRESNPLVSNSTSLFGACQRLHVERITSVQERLLPDGSVMTTMDVKVQSGNVVNQEERFSIRVERKRKAMGTSQEMQLLAFDRISAYGPHRECADAPVDVKLCVCRKKLGNTSVIASLLGEFGERSNIVKLKTCLYLVLRSFQGSDPMEIVDVYEIANICHDTHYKVTFDCSESNSTTIGACNLNAIVVLKPETMHFVASVRSEVGSSDEKIVLRLRFAMRRTNVSQWEAEEGQNKVVTRIVTIVNGSKRQALSTFLLLLTLLSKSFLFFDM